MSIHIYALIDPNTGEVRYIGKSNNPHRRLTRHIHECKARHGTTNERKRDWINALLAAGQKPHVVTLQTLEQGDDWAYVEFCWGWHYRTRGADLVNDGWDTPITAEQRAIVGNRHDVTVTAPDLSMYGMRRAA